MTRRRLFRWPFRDRGRIASDVDDEVAFHLAEAARSLEGRGMSAEVARAEVLRRFGDVSRAKRELRAMDARAERRARIRNRLAALWRDLRHGFRVLRRGPGYAVAGVLTLALGVGGTAAVFSAAHGVLLLPLPYGAPDRLVSFWAEQSWSQAEFEVAREAGTRFAGLAAYGYDAATLRQDVGAARLVPGVRASGGLFQVLGVRPELGRGLRPADNEVGAEPVVVLSHALWQEQLGGVPDVVGRRIFLNGEPRTVVGVMPRGFWFPRPESQYWAPLEIDRAARGYAGAFWLSVVGQLAEGVPVAAANDAVAPIATALLEHFTYSRQWSKSVATAVPLRASLVGDSRPAVFLLLAVVGTILLVACANVAGLMLGRAADRRPELAVRAALGASRWGLVSQLMAESVVLALLGGVVGAAFAAAAFKGLVHVLPVDAALAGTLRLDWRLALWASVAAVAAGLLVGLVPAASLLRGHLRAALGGRGRGPVTGRNRLHRALVVAEVTLTVLLVAGAVTLTRSLARIHDVDLGFDPEGVLVADLFAGNGDLDDAARGRFLYALTDRLGSAPGVETAAAVSLLPVRNGGFNAGARPAETPDAQGRALWWRNVTPGYFRAMGIELLRGRLLDRSDGAGSPDVAVINEAAANMLWPGENPIGRRYLHGSESGKEIEVVGVVANVLIDGPRAQPRPITYRPFSQLPFFLQGNVLVLRGSGDPAGLADLVRRTVRELNPAVAVDRVATMRQVVAANVADASRLAGFVLLFAALALVLGVIGVYGVVSYMVVRRRSEFGVRLALGASPRGLLGAVIGSGLTLVAAGVVLGTLALALVSRLLRGFVFGVPALDAPSVLAAAVTLILAGVLATTVPARRAARLDPSEALRSE